MRVKKAAVTAGAKVGNINVFGLYSAVHHNLPIYLSQVKHIFSAAFNFITHLGIKIFKFIYLVYYGVVYLVTALANIWPNAAKNIGGVTTKAVYHNLDSAGGNFLCGASPACVRCGYHLFNGVVKSKRGAIGILGYQHQPRTVGNKAVYIGVVQRAEKTLSCILFSYHTNVGGVGLLREYNIFTVGAKNIAETAKILCYSLGVIV